MGAHAVGVGVGVLLVGEKVVQVAGEWVLAAELLGDHGITLSV
ncbi:hypothetical protein [Streptosporangium sp. KLBMP 9127]